MIRHFNMRTLFSPAIRLLNRLSYIGKFMLIGLMCLIAAVVVVHALYTSLSQTIQLSQRQLQGLTLIEPMTRTIQAIQQHRGISATLLGGNEAMRDRRAGKEAEIDEAFKALEAKLPTGLHREKDFLLISEGWVRLRKDGLQWTVNRNFLAHTHLIEQLQLFLESVADDYALSLDSDLDKTYLLDTAINKLPHVLEHLGQIRAFGAGILSDKRISEPQKIELKAMTGELDNALRLFNVSIKRISRYNPTLSNVLSAVSDNTIASALRISALAESDIATGRFATPPEGFLDMATTEIDKAYAQIYATLLPTTETLIRTRIAGAEKKLYTSIGAALLLFLVVSYFAIGNYFVIIGSIQSFAGAARAYAEGKLNTRVRLDTQDELSQVADSFNQMADGFASLLAERDQAEEKILHMAHHDTLTGLPNRTLFNDRLEQEIRKAHRAGQKVALLFLDLDKFKEVNDTLGHNMGDILLQETAHRIGGCLREADTVARLSGDEFTVILGGLDQVGCVERVTENILQSLTEPFLLGAEKSYVSASIGVALYPDDAAEAATLLQYADQAMYAAKKAGRNGFSYFTPSMQQIALTRLYLINELHDALAASQFQLHYQPIVELATGRIDKAEALIRWQHPKLGLINPAEFIPLAEETGLIVEIGDWVFKEAMRQLKTWRALYNDRLQISVNVSPVQLGSNISDPCQVWFGYLRKMELPGQSLNIEITEGILLDAESAITGQLRGCHKEGIQIAIDDFGTGYSSLSYLKKFDIDYLKIDRSFVRDLVSDPNDMALSEAIIVMAHKLGLKVIAEGVETEEQRTLLAGAGCDYGQGYLFSKPLPSAAFDALLKNQPCSSMPLNYSI